MLREKKMMKKILEMLRIQKGRSIIMNSVLGTCLICVAFIAVLWGIIWGIAKIFSKLNDKMLSDDDK